MGTALVLLIICFAASTVGAVVGAGGGVIIKPLLDFSGLMPAATASFCSGCTVLAMSTCSLITSRGNGVKLHTRTSTPWRLARRWAACWANGCLSCCAATRRRTPWPP